MNNRFSQVPEVKFNRSKFPMNHGLKTSMSVGRLYPLEFQEVLPGDTLKYNTNIVARVTSSFIKPVVDNLYMDVYHFFVPYRLCYDRAEDVFGDSSPSAYIQEELASFPTATKANEVYSKSVADYLGLPVGKVPKGFNVLPFRAFALIYNHWFRNENVVDEVYVQRGEYNEQGETLNNAPWSATNYTGQLPFVSKKKDYFTSAVPRAQKGEAVQVSLGDTAPIKYRAGFSTLLKNKGNEPLLNVGIYSNNSDFNGARLSTTSSALLGLVNGEAKPIGIDNSSSLYTDLSEATAFNVNDLRLAFQLQKLLETSAIYGSRYNEVLLSRFGVYSPDSRLQLPEYLGGGSFPISIQQVPQMSASTEDSPLGSVGAMSLSNGKASFNKGFVEHGIVMTVGCIRQIHTYQQGVPKFFMRSTRDSFYDPMFAHLGFQPIYKNELKLPEDIDDESDLKGVGFGFSEAWADYRFIPNKITGQMRSGVENSLDKWHFGDVYENQPSLTPDFINETPDFVDRTLSVSYEVQDQFLIDLYSEVSAIRVMPTYSVPGLIDHR